MTSLRSSFVLALALLGCTRDNPAFEGGDDELLDGSSDKASEGDSVGSEGASSSVGETTNTSEPSTTDPSTSDATSDSTTDPSTSESTTDPSESTTDPSTSESTSDPVTTDPLDTFDGLDAPVVVCPLIFAVQTCMDCITVECCQEDVNAWCFEADNDCFHMLQCLSEGTHIDICQNTWTPTVEEYDTALGLYLCGKDAEACFEHCPP
jgi:hypothetical protein